MEQSETESLGLFPIDFALGSVKETIGLKNHKIIRYLNEIPVFIIRHKKTDESSNDDLPTANDYFRAGIFTLISITLQGHTLNYYPDKDQILVFGGYNGPQELYILQNASHLEKQNQTAPTWEKGI